MREQEPSTPTFQFFGTKTLREVAWFSDVRGRSRPLRFSPSIFSSGYAWGKLKRFLLDNEERYWIWSSWKYKSLRGDGTKTSQDSMYSFFISKNDDVIVSWRHMMMSYIPNNCMMSKRDCPHRNRSPFSSLGSRTWECGSFFSASR